MIMVALIGKFRGTYPERSRGISTLELVIALAILALAFSAIVLVSYGQQLVSLDSELAQQALLVTQAELATKREQSSYDFNGILSTTTPVLSLPEYQKVFSQKLTVLDTSPCLKSLASKISYQIGVRDHEVTLSSQIGQVETLLKLGADCLAAPLTSNWSSVSELGRLSLSNPGAAISLDVLLKKIYLATTQGLQSVDLSLPHSQLYLADSDGFNDLDAVYDRVRNRTYIYLARATTTAAQLLVAEDSGGTLSLVASRALNEPVGTLMEGWRLSYYDQKIYIATRYNAAKPELYVFDVSDPANPIEVGNYDPDTSIYALTVTERWDGQHNHQLAYLATSHDDKEVIVLDMSQVNNIQELTGVRTNLPGAKDARSMYLHGATLFVGLESGGGDDLYALDTRDLFSLSTGLPILDSADLSGTALALRATGNYLFLSKIVGPNQLEVWDLSDQQNLRQLSTLPLANLLRLDLAENRLYAITSSTPEIHVIQGN